MSPAADFYGIAAIAVCAIVTMGIRSLPFLVFRGDKLPEKIEYLGRMLPGSIMVILVIFCLRNTDIHARPYGLPELVCVVLCAFLQKKLRNSIPSIAISTLCYMVIIRMLG